MRRVQTIVDAMSADIRAGRLVSGDRLPPQREFADQHRIAASTASRVYEELARRGLVIGEVGRGTYVRAAPCSPGAALTDPVDARVDLELNVPIVPAQVRLLGTRLSSLVRRTAVFEAALRPAPAAGDAPARGTSASFLSRRGWRVDPGRILFAGNGKQAIAAVFATLVRPGERLGTDTLTYPVAKGLAGRLGIDLIPIAADEKGLLPDALAAAHRKTPLRAIYCQPTLHNPLGTTMPRDRRIELSGALRHLRIFAIEDAVYAFLRGDVPPLAAVAPECTVVIDSLSKRLAPGLTVGFIISPPALLQPITEAVRSGAWGASGLALAACTQWMADGTAAAISAAKRQDAAMRQRILRDTFADFEMQSDPRAYHGWLRLPRRWRAEAFVAAAAERGIAVAPASAFAVRPGHAPNAIRIALASPTIDVLKPALRTLANLARGSPRG